MAERRERKIFLSTLPASAEQLHVALLALAIAAALSVLTVPFAWPLVALIPALLPPAILPASTALRLASALLTAGFAGVFFVFALGVPVVGVVTSSLLIPFHGLHLSSFTLANYRGLLGVQGLGGPVRFSAEMGVSCGLSTLVLGAILARMLAGAKQGIATRLLDITLLAAVALPGVVFAAGYIFAYDLPLVTNLGVALYGTVPLLGMAYVANAVPQSARILLGPFAQVQESLLTAARVHGAGVGRAWRQGVLPLLARPLVWAGLLAFASLFLELPISELMAPPGVVPVSVAILRVLGKANIGLGTALSVVATSFTLAVVAVVLGLFRLLAPPGWRRWQIADDRAAPTAGAARRSGPARRRGPGDEAQPTPAASAEAAA